MASAGFVLEPASHTIRFRREFAASPAQVFAAWTEPEHLRMWWDSTGKVLASCAIDLRVGGTFTYYVQDYPEMPFVGVFREIVADERLAFDALGAVYEVTFRGSAKGTDMTVEIVCTSAEQFEQFVRMGVQIGTAGSMDNLVRYLGEGG